MRAIYSHRGSQWSYQVLIAKQCRSKDLFFHNDLICFFYDLNRNASCLLIVASEAYYYHFSINLRQSMIETKKASIHYITRNSYNLLLKYLRRFSVYPMHTIFQGWAAF